MQGAAIQTLESDNPMVSNKAYQDWHNIVKRISQRIVGACPSLREGRGRDIDNISTACGAR